LNESRRSVFGTQVPLYRSIAGLLRTDILSGKLAPGERVPTIDKLAEDFGVARVTARQALSVLIEEGRIMAQQGRGTFVVPGTSKPQVVRLESSWQKLLHMLEGNAPELLEAMDDVSAPPLLFEDGQAGQSYRYMKRLHRNEGVPYCVIEIYVAQAVYRENPPAFDDNMVIGQLQHASGLQLRRMRQNLRIATADIETARLLNIEVNAPVGVVRRVITNNTSEVIYLGVGRYRGDLVEFDTTIDLPDP